MFTYVDFMGMCLCTIRNVQTCVSTPRINNNYITYRKVIFKCDIPVVFYKFNMYSVQLAVKIQLIYCAVCTMYKKLHVSAYFGHLQVFHIA